MTQTNEPPENPGRFNAQQARLSDALSKQPHRFLVVIDDLDRLLPDEALQVFRLIKSVGRLPSVMYLLAFDRQIAEKVVAEKYPSEGPHYLEKIVQASFELPKPSSSDLNDSILDKIFRICGAPEDRDFVHFMNVFYDCIAPLVKSPRDVNRIASTIAVTWPAVRGDVNAADFAAMESMRVLHGSVYQRLQIAKDILVGGSPNSLNPQERAELKARTEGLLAGISDANQAALREVLQRLFPRTQSVWDRMSYGSDWDSEWQRMRRVCSSSYFDAYFAFSVPDDALPGSLVKELIDSTSDARKLQNLLRRELKVRRRRGGTRAALLLDEISIQGKSIQIESIAEVINGLYEIADDLDVDEDMDRRFNSFAHNELRLHWLTNRLVRERLPPLERSKLILRATKSAPLGWLVSMASRAHKEHFPDRGDRAIDEADRLCTLVHAEQLKKRALRKTREAAKDGSLLSHRRFSYILFRWHEESVKGNASAASRWLRKVLKESAAVLRVAEAFTRESWSQGSSDRVARKNTSAGTESLAKLVPLPIFRKALEVAIDDGTVAPSLRDNGRRFLDSWDQQDLRRKRGDFDFD
ncbi:MAG: P-loop NTPase fold protein [Hyphomicrobiaceae bacterium]